MRKCPNCLEIGNVVIIHEAGVVYYYCQNCGYKEKW